MLPTPEFQRGMEDRFKGKDYYLDNPYSNLFEDKRKEWRNGWKLEDWRLRKMGRVNVEDNCNARKEINRQVQTNRIFRNNAESH